ncbi:MAG: STAS/SEC14 domain-containing protein [Pseudomonadota bacterium]
MKTIASNDYYTVSVDGLKNRLFLSASGMWVKEGEVKNLVPDVQAALAELQPNLTILVDARGMQGTSLPDLFVDAQKAAVAKGIKRVASVYERESFFKLQAEEIAQTSGFPVKRFAAMEEAQAWLDEA